MKFGLDTDQLKYGILHPWEIPSFLINQWRWRRRQRQSDDWEEYYLLTTDNVADHRELVGPREVFEEHREWQFELIRDHGLEPHHTVLELGCGVLRAGLPIIGYLEPGNYIGMDISLKSLTFGHRAVHENDLELKRPLLIQNEDPEFDEVAGYDADHMLSNSVWTHLPPDRLENCITYMGKAFADDAIVLTTVVFTESDGPVDRGYGQRTGVDWGYPREWIEARVDAAGYEMDVLFVEHPTGQDVIRLQRRPSRKAERG